MNHFQDYGYQILPKIVNRNTIKYSIAEIDRYIKQQSISAIRDLHLKIPAIADLALSQQILSLLPRNNSEKKFNLIKAIFFNKNQKYNWSVPWHQDKTIAMNKKVDLPGYKNWTVKQGVLHVQPPLNILEKITTIRIALDSCDGQNGALKIIPRSHKFGILEKARVDRISQNNPVVTCFLELGDILMMHPLILHSSTKSKSDRQRRTIHLEYIGS